MRGRLGPREASSATALPRFPEVPIPGIVQNVIRATLGQSD
jgi:hypothetical protein